MQVLQYSKQGLKITANMTDLLS